MMKKLTAWLLAVMMTCALAACGGTGAGSSGSSTPPAPETSTPPTSDVAQPDATPESDPSDPPVEEVETGKTLIAYFSWSGNTEELAGMIQETTGGDLFAMEPETPYTDDYNALLDQAQQEQAEDARPALAAQVENWEQYDTIFVGYPNWWGDAPMIVLSFLESYDCTGKTVIPFCTSGGGGFGSSVDSVTASAAGATVLEGFHVGGSSVSGAKEDVAAWIDGLGLVR